MAKTDLDERTDDPMPDAIGTPSKEIKGQGPGGKRRGRKRHR